MAGDPRRNRQAAGVEKLVEQQNTLLGAGQAWSALEIYLSVDRDVMEGSFTDYGDGLYPLPQLWDFVQHFIDGLVALRGREPAVPVRFAGFDLCGLPMLNGSSKSAGPTSPADRYLQVGADLQRFATVIRSIPGRD